MASYQPPTVGESLSLYLRGIGKRWYFWLFALVFDPLEIFNKYVSPLLPTKEPVTMDISIAWFWAAVGLTFAWVSFLTYRELHKTKSHVAWVDQDTRKRLHLLVGQGWQDGRKLRDELGRDCHSADELSRKHLDILAWAEFLYNELLKEDEDIANRFGDTSEIDSFDFSDAEVAKRKLDRFLYSRYFCLQDIQSLFSSN